MTADMTQAAPASVLIVEDDADLRDLLVQFVTLEGFAATAVDNGRDALTHLESGRRPALVVLDLMMPHLDGFEFLRRQRERDDLRAIPVIVLTALDHVHADLVEGVAVLSKPVDFDRLLHLVRLHCCAQS